MAKKDSDIFICRLEEGDYWAYPSPFVAHGRGTEIQFRNLTDDTIEIKFGSVPVGRNELTLLPKAADSVNVDSDAKAGIYEYVAQLDPARAVPTTRKASPIKVKGGSPPRIIIDT